MDLHFIQTCFVPSYVVIGLQVLEKKKMKNVYNDDNDNDDDSADRQ